MDFFDDLTAAIASDGAKRGIRVSPEDKAPEMWDESVIEVK